MIEQDAREQKYAVDKHERRLSIILDKWDDITDIMRTEIPSAASIESLLCQIGCPRDTEARGLSVAILPKTFKATKDIRDKYVLSRLAFDLGIWDELAESL